jgi:transposase
MPPGGVHPINLPGHKVHGVRQAIEAAGAHLLYLPPYSPDFNPIENAFAKLKALLRKAAELTSRASGKPSPTHFAASRPRNAVTTSPPHDTMQTDRIPR